MRQQAFGTPVRTAIEIAIYLLLIFAIIAWSYRILAPFIPFLLWGGVVAIAIYPAFLNLREAVGGRNKLAVLLFVVLALAIIIVPAWFLGGFVRVWRGDPEGAIEHFTQAMRLSPLDPEMYRMQAGMAAAHLFAERFDDASSWATKSFRDLPTFLIVEAFVAASHALAGRTDESQRAMR